MSIQRAKEVIREEAKAIEELSLKVDESFERAVDLIMECQGRVIVTGMGKSGIVAQKLASTLSSTGTAAFFLHAAEGAHGDLGLVQRDDVVVMISKSGDTDELLRLLPLFRRLGVPIISLSGNPNSLLATKSDITLDCSVDNEAGSNDLIPTTSTTAAMVMGDALAMALLIRRNFRPEDFARLHPAGTLGRRLLLRVEEVMLTGKDVGVVEVGATMKEALIELVGKRGICAVVDEDEKLLGVITDGDFKRLLHQKTDFMGIRVTEVMNKNPKSIQPQALCVTAVELMEKFSIISMPVVDEDMRVIGVVHLHDLMRARVI